MEQQASGAIGDDGYVRLRAYLPSAATIYLSLSCRRCHRHVDLSFPKAIRLAGSGDLTVGQLARRLRCTECGSRGFGLSIAPDPRPPETRQREGLLPQVRD